MLNRSRPLNLYIFERSCISEGLRSVPEHVSGHNLPPAIQLICTLANTPAGEPVRCFTFALMELKDYYDILELTQSATAEEIKKSYRRLALAYHPDKNADDPYAAARFAVVKEAYEVLTDPIRKNNYMQERWLAKATGKFTSAPLFTPENLLRQLIEKERVLARMDKHRMNSAGVTEELLNLFSGEATDMLNSFGEIKMNSEIVRLAIRASDGLNHQAKSTFYRQLERIHVEPGVDKDLRRSLEKQFNSERWDRNRIWLLLFVVIAICILIFLIGS